LSRKIDERIIIDGGEIVVTVVDVRGNKVWLGFEADKKHKIHRDEVQELIDRERDGK
jgi:carbon storage regulator